MKEEHYYIPSIEEFYIGFEYEYYIMNTWQKVAFHPSDFAYTENWLDNLDKGLLRVKYLDKEDIESFGFKFSPARDYQTLYTKADEKPGFNRYESLDGRFMLQHYIEDDTIVISTKLFILVLRIIIKNKSEFRKLLKQLQIN